MKARKLFCQIALLLVLAGCTTNQPTKAEFVAKGDKRCAEFEKEAARVTPPPDPFSSKVSTGEIEQETRFLDHFANSLPKLAEDLRDLGLPKSDKAKAEEFLSGLSQSGALLATAAAAYKAGDKSGAQTQSTQAFAGLEKAGASAQAYGFRACGAVQTTGAPGGPEGAKVQVAATEYAFEMPASIAPGPTTFVMENRGNERHHLSLIRLKGGSTVNKALDAERIGEDADLHIESQAGQSAAAAPGKTVKFTADLAAGEYGYACFIVAGDGEPHAFKGMAGQLKVG